MNRPARFGTDTETMLIAQIRGHGRLFFRLAYGVLRDADAAEDVCQQAFLKAWERKDQIRERAALQAWLAKVVINESLQLRRRRKREQPARDARVGANEAGVSVLEKAEFHDLFRAALAELPEKTRVVVVLRLIEGMTGNDVKSLLGCSASQVSRRLHRGLGHLRKRLAHTYAKE